MLSQLFSLWGNKSRKKQRSKAMRSKRVLQLESLENREVMSTFNGSSLADVITVALKPSDSTQLQVSWTSNGVAQTTQYYPANTSLSIFSSDGNDVIVISDGLQNNSVTESIYVNGGNGDDAISEVGTAGVDNVTQHPSAASSGSTTGLPASISFDNTVERVTYYSNGGGTAGSAGDVVTTYVGTTQLIATVNTGSSAGNVYHSVYGSTSTESVTFTPASTSGGTGQINVGSYQPIYSGGSVYMVQYYSNGGNDVIAALPSTTNAFAALASGTGTVYVQTKGTSASEGVTLNPAPSGSTGAAQIGSLKPVYFNSGVYEVDYASEGGSDTVEAYPSVTQQFYVNKTGASGSVDLKVFATVNNDIVSIYKPSGGAAGVMNYSSGGLKSVYFANNMDEIEWNGGDGNDTASYYILYEPVKYDIYSGSGNDTINFQVAGWNPGDQRSDLSILHSDILFGGSLPDQIYYFL